MSRYYEIVTYQISEPHSADTARASAQNILKTFPGYVSWTALSGAENTSERADIVTWRSLADAKAAAQAVGTANAFAEFRTSVAHITTMGHYVPTTGAAHTVCPGDGIELGRFRLNPGVTETQIRAAHTAMVQSHLSHQPGWLKQHLVKLNNDVYIDIAYADSQEHARAICASWAGQAACDAFLSLIEAESMEFGTVL